MDETMPPEGLPDSWRDDLSGRRWIPQTGGLSGAHVFRLDRDRYPSLFVKQERIRPHASVPEESARLRWLAGRAVPCPRIVRADVHGGCYWLLTTAVPGRDAASCETIPPRTVVDSVAAALRNLHAEPIAGCPFDHRAARRLAQARILLDEGEADAADIEAAVPGYAAADLLAELEATRPREEVPVLTHGDACLENLLLDSEGRFTGFVDCGRVGVADRYQDIALACRSIAENLGQGWVQPFLNSYGLASPDPARIRFYQLLDEFF